MLFISENAACAALMHVVHANCNLVHNRNSRVWVYALHETNTEIPGVRGIAFQVCLV